MRCVHLLFTAMAPVALLGAPAGPYGQGHATTQRGDAPEDEIVVTGARLRSTKVDYRRKGAAITFCGPRDAQQDADAVRMICGFVEDCVFRGSRETQEISRCVEGRMARKRDRHR
jgi:hypothetical protein